MIISTKHKFIVLNAPKTGSGFREDQLRPFIDISNDTVNDDIRHLKAKEAFAYCRKKNLDPNEFYWVAFARNPWTRVESFFNQVANEILHEERHSPRYGTVPKEELFSPGFLLKFVQNQRETRHRYPLGPQSEYYIKPNGEDFDFIGQLETMQEGIDHILSKFNINHKIQTHEQHFVSKFGEVREKSSYHQEVKKLWREESIEIIRKLEQKTIEKFNYAHA